MPKTSKTFCMLKRSIFPPRIGLPQGRKKKAIQINRTKPIQTLEQRVINDFRCAISYLLQIETNMSQYFPPLDFPNSFLSLSMFLKKIQVNQSLPRDMTIKSNPTPQVLASDSCCRTKGKNKNEKIVISKLNRAKREI